jgi:hypothetical protein
MTSGTREWMGYLKSATMEEPAEKRAVAFFDGQNLYRHAKEAFGHHYPNYDPIKLFDAVCAHRGWTPFGVRFYTGTPTAIKAPMWHGFWSNKLLALRRAGVLVYSRPIRYRELEIQAPDGSFFTSGSKTAGNSVRGTKSGIGIISSGACRKVRQRGPREHCSTMTRGGSRARQPVSGVTDRASHNCAASSTRSPSTASAPTASSKACSNIRAGSRASIGWSISTH